MGGSVVIWETAQLVPILRVGGEVPMSRLEGDVSPCTALALVNGVAIAGFLSGRMRLFDVVSRRKLADVAAHAGSINALAVSSDGANLASVGDDGRVQVWSLPEFSDGAPIAADGFLSVAFSATVPNRLLVGCAFHPLSANLIVSCYDSDRLLVFPKAAPP